MSELNIPNLNKKNDKYLFKKKLPLRRKSKKRLFNESLLMFVFSFLLIYINYLIPNKQFLFNNFSVAFEKSILLIIELFSYLFQIFLLFFIVISLLASLTLFIGAIYRVVKILRRKTKKYNL